METNSDNNIYAYCDYCEKQTYLSIWARNFILRKEIKQRPEEVIQILVTNISLKSIIKNLSKHIYKTYIYEPTKKKLSKIIQLPNKIYQSIIMLRKIKTWETINMGCDPEFFFKTENKIIGAEKIIPKEGLQSSYGKIIIDGVQAELNPIPSFCRQSLATFISESFRTMNNKLAEHSENKVSIDFNSTVEITPEEMESLHPSAQQFGCSPSTNAYHKKSSIQIKDASKYMFRSAGGHIHLGKLPHELGWKTLRDTKRMVPMLDLLVGLPSVLIDRNPGNIERRKNYGRAGEYRLPKHGLEYRTLSNFWLQSYPLMSLVFGLTRYAYNICNNNLDTYFKRGIKMKDVEKAINTNDFDLALKIFKQVEKKIIGVEPKNPKFQHALPLTKNTLPAFEHFINKGTNYWFKEDPVTHWMNYTKDAKIANNGWENFISQIVTKDIPKVATPTTT